MFIKFKTSGFYQTEGHVSIKNLNKALHNNDEQVQCTVLDLYRTRKLTIKNIATNNQILQNYINDFLKEHYPERLI